ncbi:hypothetical protein C8F01DRAFT_1080954 [Mycena amicta]|nr:hypothetical protein C8F01DRAFT_1080954 [Mycena amicta]
MSSFAAQMLFATMRARSQAQAQARAQQASSNNSQVPPTQQQPALPTFESLQRPFESHSYSHSHPHSQGFAGGFVSGVMPQPFQPAESNRDFHCNDPTHAHVGFGHAHSHASSQAEEEQVEGGVGVEQGDAEEDDDDDLILAEDANGEFVVFRSKSTKLVPASSSFRDFNCTDPAHAHVGVGHEDGMQEDYEEEEALQRIESSASACGAPLRINHRPRWFFRNMKPVASSRVAFRGAARVHGHPENLVDIDEREDEELEEPEEWPDEATSREPKYGVSSPILWKLASGLKIRNRGAEHGHVPIRAAQNAFPIGGVKLPRFLDEGNFGVVIYIIVNVNPIARRPPVPCVKAFNELDWSDIEGSVSLRFVLGRNTHRQWSSNYFLFFGYVLQYALANAIRKPSTITCRDETRNAGRVSIDVSIKRQRKPRVKVQNPSRTCEISLSLMFARKKLVNLNGKCVRRAAGAVFVGESEWPQHNVTVKNLY